MGEGNRAAPPSDSDRVRRLIERGLERYGRGQLQEAINEWEHALMLDEKNVEARHLVDFVKDRLLNPGAQAREFVVPPLPGAAERTGWALGAEPPPRPTAEVDTPTPEKAPPAKTILTWGGRGRVEPIGIPGDPEPPTPAEEDVSTDPGPAAMSSALDEIDWSDVNPATDGKAVEPPTGGPAGRSRRPTLESNIPALLAASMPEPAGDVPAWGPEPATPRVRLSDMEARGNTPAEMPAEPPSSPQSAGTLDFDDIAGDPTAAARRRAGDLIERARAEFEAGNMEAAAEAAEFALTEDERAPPPGIAEVIEPVRPMFERIFQAHVGPGQGVPTVNLTAHEISAMTFDHRTGFLLSRIDGVMTFDELLDISGMGAFESFRILSSLLRAGIIGAA